MEGGEPDGVLLEEEILCEILAKRKSWAGLKCGKNQASSPAWPYVLLAFVLGITLMLGVAMRGAELCKVFGSSCASELGVRCWAGHQNTPLPHPILLVHHVRVFIWGLFTPCEKWSSLLCMQEGSLG